MNALEISLSALDVEWRRLEIAARNLANMNTTRTAEGGAYVPLRLVSGPAEPFGQVLGREGAPPAGAQPSEPRGVRVYGIEPAAEAFRSAYEPRHPDADARGFVTYPNVSQAGEMTLMMRAARAYEANLVAMAAAQQIYSSALQIGRPS